MRGILFIPGCTGKLVLKKACFESKIDSHSIFSGYFYNRNAVETDLSRGNMHTIVCFEIENLLVMHVFSIFIWYGCSIYRSAK